jgi:hypothetical protein
MASGLPGGEGFLNEFPHLLVAERLHALLHVGRPVGTVLIHLDETGGDLRVASGKSFHEFFPARGQCLGLLAGGIFPECDFHIAEEVRPFLGPAFLIFWRPKGCAEEPGSRAKLPFRPAFPCGSPGAIRR